MYCLANSASHGSGACAGRSAKFLSSRLEPLGGFQPRRLQANTSRDGWWHRAGGEDSSSSSWWNNSRGWNDWTWKSSDWSSRSNWRAGASDTYAKPRNHRGKRSLEKQAERIAKGNAKPLSNFPAQRAILQPQSSGNQHLLLPLQISIGDQIKNLSGQWCRHLQRNLPLS